MKCRCWQRLVAVRQLDPYIFGRGCSFCREPSILRGAISGPFRSSNCAQGMPEETSPVAVPSWSTSESAAGGIFCSTVREVPDSVWLCHWVPPNLGPVSL